MSVIDTTPSTRVRPARPTRRVGYVVGAAVNVILLLLVNTWPGWAALPFLTTAFADVLGWVNLSITTGVMANLVYLVADPPRLRAAGDVLVTAVGLVPLAALWQTFPFTFPGQSIDWELVVRILLGLGLGGSVIGIVAALVRLVTGRAP